MKIGNFEFSKELTLFYAGSVWEYTELEYNELIVSYNEGDFFSKLYTNKYMFLYYGKSYGKVDCPTDKYFIFTNDQELYCNYGKDKIKFNFVHLIDLDLELNLKSDRYIYSILED